MIVPKKTLYPNWQTTIKIDTLTDTFAWFHTYLYGYSKNI